MIPRERVEQVLAVTSLIEVVSLRVDLVKRGREHLGLCPFHDERTASFRVYRSHFHCFGCGAHGNVFDFVTMTEGLAFPDAVKRLAAEAGIGDGDGIRPVDHAELERQRERRRQERERGDRDAAVKLQRALEIWRGGGTIHGSPAEIYLRSRGLDPAKLLSEPRGWPESLRWSPDASTELDGRGRPALIVAVNDACTGLVCGLQRIFLRPDGAPVLVKKGDVAEKLKLSLGVIAGNAARFSCWPDRAGRWGIAEGPETALAATQLFRFPVWSAISSGNMPNVLPPAWAHHVTILADNDDGGLVAADDARRVYQENLGVDAIRVIVADRVRADMADLLREGA